MGKWISCLKIGCTIVLAFCSFSSVQAGVGTGRVVDITLRTQDNLLLVKVAAHNTPPACVNWYHTFAKPYDGSATSKALYAMLLSAQASGKLVRISGTENCLAGTGAEEIREINIGDWQ